jgi:hypothetical protein
MGHRTPSRCPSCGDRQVALIQYGLPLFDDELHRAIDEGDVVLGGCVVWPSSPRWACVGCGHRWGGHKGPFD